MKKEPQSFDESLVQAMARMAQRVPCKGCQRRWIDRRTNCHATCTDYLRFCNARAWMTGYMQQTKQDEYAVRFGRKAPPKKKRERGNPWGQLR